MPANGHPLKMKDTLTIYNYITQYLPRHTTGILQTYFNKHGNGFLLNVHHIRLLRLCIGIFCMLICSSIYNQHGPVKHIYGPDYRYGIIQEGRKALSPVIGIICSPSVSMVRFSRSLIHLSVTTSGSTIPESRGNLEFTITRMRKI